MSPLERPRLLPAIPPAARFACLGLVIAGLAYVMTAVEHAPAAPLEPSPTTVVAVPQLDRDLLATAQDATREQRLLLEPEPLRHLLAKSIDVGPTVAAALGMPETPVPLPAVQGDAARWRGSWLFYEGQLEALAGPREGHPIRGYSIYEATVRLADGGAVMAAFSTPPEASIQPGQWVRIEGYLLKLRDTTYPTRIEQAPLLVGRAIQPDYDDWGPVTALDTELLAAIDDSSWWPGDLMSRSVEQDQTPALWHLAAFVRDTRQQRTAAEWRRIGTLNTHDVHEKLKEGELPRGTPMRIFGPLIQRATLAAPSNPAGIKWWTVAWVQVREYGGGVLVPIWIPHRVRELPERAQLEVHGFYYRWFAYDTLQNERRRTPLFVAADLDLYDLHIDRTMQSIGWVLGSVAVLGLSLLLLSQRRAARSAIAHSRDRDARRRRQRERQAARATASSAGTPPPP
jgi:hypothetical protein